MLGIVDTRQLDEDAVRSFALDRRLFGAGLVDAAADDLDRLIDRCLPSPFGGDGAEPHRPRPVRGDVDRQVGIDLAPRARAASMRSGSRSVKVIASPSTLSPV